MRRSIKTLHNFQPPAADEVTRAAHVPLGGLVAHAPPRDRGVEAATARARSAVRFGKAGAGTGS